MRMCDRGGSDHGHGCLKRHETCTSFLGTSHFLGKSAQKYHCHGLLKRQALLTVTKQARDKLALPNALNLLFGELLLVRATLSIRALENDLLEPFGAVDRYALRFGSLFSLMEIHVRLNGMVLEHSV